MNINFKQQQVLITGGTRGIGKEIAISFLKNEAELVVITGTAKDFDLNLFENLTESERSKLRYKQVDFLHSARNLQIDQIIEDFGHFHVCINNAGINIVENINDLKEQNLRDVLEVNLIAPAILISKISIGMIANKYGKIINISSIFGQVTKEGRLNYSSSKFGLIGQTKAAALDLAKHNILVNSVAPGFIATDLTLQVLGEKGIKEMTEKVPLKRLGQPDEVAHAVLFLASKINSFITAETLTVDGGCLAT